MLSLERGLQLGQLVEAEKVCHNINGHTLELIQQHHQSLGLLLKSQRKNSTRSVSLNYSGTTNQSYTVGDRYTTSVYGYFTAYGRLEIWEID